jgi:hypothetical protein
VNEPVPDQSRESVADRFQIAPSPVDLEHIIGLSRAARGGVFPLNGLRHPPVGETSGWYVWSGQILEPDPDFFESHHLSHLEALCPEVVPYLELPPGWRFLIAPGYEDVWYDGSLLEP